MANVGTRALFGDYETTRMGHVYGPDEMGQLVQILARTFHLKFGSVKIGGKGRASPRGAMNYIRRKSEHGPLKDGKLDELERKLAEARTARDEAARAGADERKSTEAEAARREKKLAEARERDRKSGEVECEAGDHKAVLRAAKVIESSARITGGDKAERVFVSETFELPAHASAEQRAACTQAIVDDWAKRGHPAHAVVHGNGKVQPHVHVLAAARPIRRDGEGVEYADRSVRLLVGREAVRERRHQVAAIINAACPGPVRFHPGRHEAVGIDREARRAAGLLQTPLPGRARRFPDEYGPGPGAPAAREGAKLARAREEALQADADAARKKVARHRERVIEDAARAADRVRAGEDRVAGLEAGTAEVQSAGALTKRQREAMQGAIERGGKEADLESGVGQALGFALLNLERARRREKEARKRKEVLEKAGQDAAVAERHGAEKDETAEAPVGGRGANVALARTLSAREAAQKKAAEIEAQPEDHVLELEERQVEPLTLTESQREMLVGVCGRKGIDGDPVHDAQAQLLAWAAHHEEREDERDRTEEKIFEAVQLAVAVGRAERRPAFSAPLDVANARAALDSAPELDEAMRERRRAALALFKDGLVDDDPASDPEAAYLGVPLDRAAIELLRTVEGVQYDTGRGLHWIKAGHENAGALLAHFGEVHPPRREREGVTYLSVPGDERDLAVEAGALYDQDARRYRVPDGADPAPFAAWTGLAAEAVVQAERRALERRRVEVLTMPLEDERKRGEAETAKAAEDEREDGDHGERRDGRAGAGTGADARGERRQPVDGGERPDDGVAAQGRSAAGHAGGAPGAHGTGGAGRAQDGADVSGGDRVAPAGAGEGGGPPAQPPVAGDRGQGLRDQPGVDAGHDRVDGGGNLHAGGEKAAPPLGGEQPLDQGADVARSRGAADADALAGLDDLLRRQADQWKEHDRNRDARSAPAARPAAPDRSAQVNPKKTQAEPKKTKTTTSGKTGRGGGLGD